MMKKVINHIRLTLLSIASFLLLVHIAIPHHIHLCEDNSLYMVNIFTVDSLPGHHHHNHTNDTECSLKNIVVSTVKSIVSKNPFCKNYLCNIHITPQHLKGLPTIVQYRPYCNDYHLNFITLSLGLRAPPVFIF